MYNKEFMCENIIHLLIASERKTTHVENTRSHVSGEDTVMNLSFTDVSKGGQMHVALLIKYVCHLKKNIEWSLIS